jgi:hypothetical protein
VPGETQELVRAEGRPSKYQPEYAEQTYKLCLLGATDPEIANFFDVCEATVHNWKRDFPEFLEAIKNGKIKADAQVAYKLHGRAVGAEWEEEQAIKVKTGQFTEDVKIVKVNRVAPPDTGAAIMWLTNRQKALWRNTQSLQQLDKNGQPTDAPMRVVIELVGDPAPLRVEHEERATGSRLTETVRKSIDFVG